MKEEKQTNIVNIRFSDRTLGFLDEMVKDYGYKSRSDCVKSLIEEKYNSIHSGPSMDPAELVQLLRDEPAFIALVESIVSSTLKKVLSAGMV